MKIITTSKFYYEKSDTESYLFNISSLLRNYKNEVVPFATKHKKNLKTVYEVFFAPEKENKSLKKSLIFKNPEAQKKLSLLLNTIQPEVLWNFGINKELLPYILLEAKKRDLQVIQTVSDDALIQNKPNFLARLTGSTSSAINDISINKDLKYYSSNINTFIAPSQFLVKKMIQEGIPKEKIVHIPAFISSGKIEPNYDSKDYFVYTGELTEKNGIKFLVKAMKNLPQHKLIILGNGELKADTLYQIEKENLKNISLIESFTQDLKNDIIQNARFVINPSQWYTSSPNSILESYAAGKPTLATNLGGIKEYIADGYSGYLFEYNNKEEMCNKINFMMENPKITKEMGVFARSLADNCYNSEIHYYKIFNLLNTTIQSNKALSRLSYKTVS